MKFNAALIINLALVASMLLGCHTPVDPDNGGNEPVVPTFVISGVEIPSSISVEYGQDYTFSVKGKGPAKGDKITFAEVGKPSNTVTVDVKSATNDSFTITIPEELDELEYSMKVTRGDVSFNLTSSVKVTIIIKLPKNPSSSSSVYGLVLGGKKGLEGVSVSDGYEVVVTDKDGFYEFSSEKQNGYVFVSLPSGYTVEADGVVPLIWKKTAKAASEAERIDFTLVPDGDQTNHTMLVFGDMHLANRTNDRTQFASFTREINDYLTAHKGEKVYALTLGDMTWDLYWYSNNYTFKEYLADISAIKGLKVFHTIGNHDHDMNAIGDWDTVVKYKDMLGPNYYSFNIGDVHYIVLDDIQCTNATPSKTDGSVRQYVETVVPDDLNWLMKDLKTVSKDTPIVVSMHAPVFTQTGSYNLKNSEALIGYFKGYSNVRFVTGHSHKIWNIDSGNIHENNSGAVCAAWWWAGNYHSKLNIAQDGAPGGYRVMDVRSKTINSYFKGTGRGDDYQFRTYDRNSINIDSESSSKFNDALTKYGAYNTASKANQVLINVWDYNSDWTISVTEDGKPLSVVNSTLYDPLYMIAYCRDRFANGAESLTFPPFKTNHFFYVIASSPNSTLEITVTDDEGRTYKETMKRPKAFNLETYY